MGRVSLVDINGDGVVDKWVTKVGDCLVPQKPRKGVIAECQRSVDQWVEVTVPQHSPITFKPAPTGFNRFSSQAAFACVDKKVPFFHDKTSFHVGQTIGYHDNETGAFHTMRITGLVAGVSAIPSGDVGDDIRVERWAYAEKNGKPTQIMLSRAFWIIPHTPKPEFIRPNLILNSKTELSNAEKLLKKLFENVRDRAAGQKGSVQERTRILDEELGKWQKKAKQQEPKRFAAIHSDRYIWPGIRIALGMLLGLSPADLGNG